MLNKFILSIALTCFISSFSHSQRDPKNSTHLLTLDSKMAFLDYMPLNDSCVVVMKSIGMDNFIEVVGSVELSPQKLEIEHPIGFRQDDQNGIYLITPDLAYKLIIGEKVSFEAAQTFSDLSNNELTKPIEFVSFYRNGWTDLLVFDADAAHPDTISINADFRNTELISAMATKTADLSKTKGFYHNSLDRYNIAQKTYNKEVNAERKMEQTRRRQFSKKSYSQSHRTYAPQYFMDGDELLIVDGEARNIARYSKDGTLLSVKQIDYARPLIWSLGTDTFKYDDEQKKLIICSENSKGYQYSTLDPKTGVATLVFKTKKYWRKSHSKTVGSKLYYIQSNSFGVDQLYSVAV